MGKLADLTLAEIRAEKRDLPPNKYRALVNPVTVGVSAWFFGFWKTLGGMLLMNRLANEEDRYTTERDLYRPIRPMDQLALDTRMAQSRKRLAEIVEESRPYIEASKRRKSEADQEAEQIRRERKAMDEVVGQKIQMCPYCGKRHRGECQ